MKILLVGYYGFGNVGDDICLEKTQVILNQKFFSPVIWILANQDNDHLNMIDRWNFFLVIKTIFCVDAIVFGGGISNEIDFLDQIKKKTSSFINEPNLKTVFLKPKYGDASGVRGAAILSRQNSI